jgi:hypothetical protein
MLAPGSGQLFGSGSAHQPPPIPAGESIRQKSLPPECKPQHKGEIVDVKLFRVGIPGLEGGIEYEATSCNHNRAFAVHDKPVRTEH